MKIGIISDSHDHFENIKKAVAAFRERAVDRIIHLGDYVNPASIRLFEGERLVGIFGNNDGDTFRLMNAFSGIGAAMMGDFHEFEADGLKFACYHGTEPQLRESLIRSGTYDVVLYGHTHAYQKDQVGRTLAINPGTAHGFWKLATVVVFHTETRETEVIEL